MPIDMNEAVQVSQALSIDILGKAFQAQAARLQVIADQKFSEVDPVQAASIKELGKAGENPRYQPQTPPGAASTL